MFNFLHTKNKVSESIQNGFNVDFKGFAKQYTDPNGYNIILSKNLQLSLNSSKTNRNNNVLVSGMAGSGKSRYVITPNLLQANGSYMVIDTGGCYYHEMADFFVQRGYNIKVLNLRDPSKSHCYNPFEYIADEKDIRDMVDCIMLNSGGISPFCHTFDPETLLAFQNQVRAWLTILITYVSKLDNKCERTFTTVANVINKNGGLEDIWHIVHNSFEFSFLQMDCEAVRKTENIKLIIQGILHYLNFVLTGESKAMMSNDEMELNSFGERKSICFILAPTCKSTTCVASLICTQFQNIMEKQARKYSNGKLPIQATCILDEFANFGRIPNLSVRLATCRLRNMNYFIVVQDIDQIRKLYRADWKEIICNCDSNIHITLRHMEDMPLIYTDVTIARKMFNVLMQDASKCLVVIRGEEPFIDHLLDEKDIDRLRLN